MILFNTILTGFRHKNILSFKRISLLVVACFAFSFTDAQNATATWPLTQNAAAAKTGNITVNNATFGSGVGSPVYSLSGVSVSKMSEPVLMSADYLQFSLSPASGYTFTITDILTTNNVSVVAAANNARFAIQYAYSGDFSSPVTVESAVILTATATTTTRAALGIFVPAGKTVYIRIYAWGLSAETTTFTTKELKVLGNACPAVSITYPNQAYCKYPGTTATPTRVGLSGGTYSAPAGLVINSTTGVVDIAGSTAGTYLVTYAVAGGITGCTTVYATTTISINALPLAFTLTGPDGATGAFCTNGTPATFTLSGSQEGVTYTFNAINPGGNTPPGQNFTVPGVGGTLEFVQTPDGKWSYKVTGKDDLTGCTNTMEGLLTAVDGPRVTTQPATAATACIGGAKTALTLNATNANDLKWEVSTNGGTTWTTIGDNTNYSVTKAGNNATTTLEISNYTAGMNGYQYRVLLAGPAACPKNYSTPTVLTVVAPQAFVSQPQAQTVCHNSTLTLAVSAVNVSTYQWYKDGVLLAEATGATYTKTFNAATDAGTYQVKITGSCGSLTSNAFTVSTNTNPTSTTWRGPVAGGTPTGTAWEQAANWTCGVPTRTVDAIIPVNIMDGYPTIKPAVSGEVRNLNINGGGFGAFLTVQGKLSIFGTVTNNGGVFDAAAGTIELAGSSVQTLTASLFAGNTVENLIISNNVSLTGELNLTGALTFGPVSDKTFATADFLTLKSSQAATARVGDLTNNNASSGNAITGNVTVERFIPAHNSRRWRLLTAPVAGTTIHKAWQEDRTWNGNNAEPGQFGTLITGQAQGNAGIANTNGFDFWTAIAGSAASVRRYIPSSGLSSNMGANWAALENTTTAGFSGNEAYLLFVRGDRTVSTGSAPGVTNLRAKGPLKQKTSYDLAVPATQSHTLVGNPYASPIDFSKFYAANNTRIKPYYWLWRASLGTAGGYVMVQPNGKGGYEAVPGDGTAATVDPIIGSGEAFFVVPAADALPGNTVTLREQHKATGKPSMSVLRQADGETPKLRANLLAQVGGETVLLDGILAQFSGSSESASIQKAVNINENLSIWKEGSDLILAGRPLPTRNDSLQLRVWNTTPGQYTLELKGSGFPQHGTPAVLYDRFAKRETSLNLAGGNVAYTFEVTEEAGAKDHFRFVVYFKTARIESLPLVTDTWVEKKPLLYPNPVRTAAANLQLSTRQAGAYRLSLYTPGGQLVAAQLMQHNGGTASYPVPVAKLASGTYWVDLTGPDIKKQKLQLVVTH